ncbi:NAD(P)-dependent dehydrogenase (short-subunit alcohol dehydrogenase family) [Runella defluvii]|uniref:NAD(P)-dependent dehydrogenase (Short-subunit alcohol dehydrogenase family) n=1 Tax=Runella defluvii TaxID=370973 RepID=A0A7W5ZSK6_9BACT|nr:3-oxoacyl-ACP reductase family protein [Runella defluvii]MBB3842121.1 NAD(P)-dependent dehydrogenase (short-subunit alcohol dehydrogenase family) [Runella defluvii]
MKEKVVIITGAAGGLGRAFALGFASAGAKVAVCDLNLAGAEETAAMVGEDALALKVDVADEASTEQMARTVIEKWGRIDVLVNNAAIYATIQRKPFYEITVAEWDLVMNVNLKGAWLCTKAVAKHMIQERRASTANSEMSTGKIINISSATVMSGSPMWSHYVASKGGVIGLTRSMAKELGEFNITVNAIAPGFTLTDASLNLIENAQKYGVERGAIKRSSTAEDIVGTALYLASSASDFVTGQTIVVDGGKQFL